MFGKLDRYIARGFLMPFLVALGVIVGLSLVAEAFSNLDDFLHEAGNFFEAMIRLTEVYALRIPTYAALVLPVAVLVGAAYGISQLSNRNEITAMKAGGLSFWRILAPVYGMAVVICFLGLANREWLVPTVERLAAPQMQKWSGKSDDSRVVIYLESESTLFTMTYNVPRKQARNMTIVQRLPDGRVKELTALRAEPAPGGWLLHDVSSRGPTAGEMLWKTSLRTRDLDAQLLPPDKQPIPDLLRDIRHAKTDDEKRPFRFCFYERLAYPLTGLILIAIGVPFVVGNERIQRSRMLGLGVCIVIGLVFYIVQFICRNLGNHDYLPPPLAAFLPIIIFGALGLYLLDTVHT